MSKTGVPQSEYDKLKKDLDWYKEKNFLGYNRIVALEEVIREKEDEIARLKKLLGKAQSK